MANKGINLNHYDVSALDKKFEKMDRETIKAMRGTGSNLGGKSKTKTSTTKKKVKRK